MHFNGAPGAGASSAGVAGDRQEEAKAGDHQRRQHYLTSPQTFLSRAVSVARQSLVQYSVSRLSASDQECYQQLSQLCQFSEILITFGCNCNVVITA